MSDKQQRALAGFALGVFGLAVMQKAVDREAAELGLPHVVAGIVVAAVTQAGG